MIITKENNYVCKAKISYFITLDTTTELLNDSHDRECYKAKASQQSIAIINYSLPVESVRVVVDLLPAAEPARG